MSKPALPKIDKQQPAKKQEEPQVVATLGEVKVDVVTVTVPYTASVTNGYESRRCDLGTLSREQARKLNAIRRGYDYREAKQANGAPIKSLADAVKALLDSIEI